MKYIDFSEKKSYIKLNNYKNIDFTNDILLYISLSFNEMPKNWYTVISIMENDYDNQAVFNFRIKDNYAQWYYGNDTVAIVLDVFNFNRFFEKGKWNEIILIRKGNCFLKIFVNSVLVGIKSIVNKGKPKNKVMPLSIMRGNNYLVQAKLKKLYISTRVDDISDSDITKLENKFNYIFDLEYDYFPSYKLISNHKTYSFKETISKKVNLEWVSTLNDFDFNVVNDVIVTDNGFLFLYQGKQRQIDYFTGLLKPSKRSIDNFRKNIVNRRAYCINKDIDYLHIVYPAKPIVKSSFLPRSISSEVSSIFLNYYYSESVDFVLYPLDELKIFNNLESMSKETFRVKDTHMTDFGYSCIAKIILKKLGMDFNLLNSFLEVEEKFCSSDLQVMMGDRTKTIELVYSPCNNTFDHIYYDNRELLSGNTGNIVLNVNKSSLTDKSLLIFGDSFFKDSLKMFIPFFKNVLFVRSSFFLKDIVELFDPDIVITSNAERYLSEVLIDEDHRIKSPLFHEDLKGDKDSVREFREAWEAFLSIKYYPHIYHSWYKEN